MWDSSGRARSPGKFDARWTDFGRYEACVDIEVAERNITVINNNDHNTSQEIIIPAFNGKYARLFYEYSPNKAIHDLVQSSDKGMQYVSSNPSTATFKPKQKWNISVDVNGEDKLSDHKDFGLDFEALGIDNVLAQDFILVRLKSSYDIIQFKKESYP